MKYTKETFIDAIKKIPCWREFIEFCESCEGYQEIIETTKHQYRLWFLENGLEDFALHCDWDKLEGYNWSCLLLSQPQFSIHCDWNKLKSWDWVELLVHQPQFAEHCEWDKISEWAWSRLIQHQPQFKKYKG